MKYKSTRSSVKELHFVDTILTGLADDGGLFIPKYIPQISKEKQAIWRKMDYKQLCLAIMQEYIDEFDIPKNDLKSIIDKSYANFRENDIVLVKKGCVNEKLKEEIKQESIDEFFLELFHGPTYAFKDIALQFLGVLLDYILKKRGKYAVILCATSGDTGSASIAGLGGNKCVECVVLFPAGRTSKIQQLQMTTTLFKNVHCLAVDGVFDDCQDIVKGIFLSDLKSELNLIAVNSINWSRILVQIVYYWFTTFKVQSYYNDENVLVNFSVPTGNFGNILAAYYAREMGASIGNLIISSNENDILTRFYTSGNYITRIAKATISPAMDIQVSSNFERFLFYAMNGNSKDICDCFTKLKTYGQFSVDKNVLKFTQKAFRAHSASDLECLNAIMEIYNKYNFIIDPHTAVGYVCGKKFIKENSYETSIRFPMVYVCTAHPGKFYESIKSTLEKENVLFNIPKELEDLKLLPQQYTCISSSSSAVEDFLKHKFNTKFYKLKMKAKVLFANFDKICYFNVAAAVVATLAVAFTFKKYYKLR